MEKRKEIDNQNISPDKKGWMCVSRKPNGGWRQWGEGQAGWGRGSGTAQLHTTAHWLGMHEVS